MATFVLVHPAWFGGWCWKQVEPRLRAHGHEVHTPTLTGLGDRAHLVHPGIDLRTHIDDIARLLICQDLEDAVLVGNSSGGMVITGVAGRVPERIRHLVYLDAFVPEDGECLMDLIVPDRRTAIVDLVDEEGFGWLLPRFAQPPWEQFLPGAWEVPAGETDWLLDRLCPTPFGHFTCPVRLTHPARARRTFIRCTRWPSPTFERFAARAAESAEWELRELDASHVPFVTAPEELAELLDQLVTS